MALDRDLMTLGGSIKKYRTEQKLTLDEVARIAGVSKALLSRAENARTAISFSVLVRVARALGVGVSELVQDLDRPSKKHYVVTRKADRERVQREAGEGYFYESLCSQLTSDGVMQTFLVALEGDTKREMVSNDGDEFLYVVSGSMQLCFEGEETVELDKGDAIFFDGRVPHVSVHRGAGEAVTLVVYLLEEQK